MLHYYGHPGVPFSLSEDVRYIFTGLLFKYLTPPVQRSLSWPRSQNVGQTPLGASAVGGAYPCAPVGIGPMAFHTASRLPLGGYSTGGVLPRRGCVGPPE